jgi:hypothetical protein
MEQQYETISKFDRKFGGLVMGESFADEGYYD